MNYLPWIGFWMYRAASDAERYVRYVSYGMKATAPSGSGPSVILYLKKLIGIGR